MDSTALNELSCSRMMMAWISYSWNDKIQHILHLLIH